MGSNIADTLNAAAARFPDKAAVIDPGRNRNLTFCDLHNLTAQYANTLLEMKVGRGTRVMVMVKPSADFIALTFALFQIGAVVILIDPGMGYDNLRKCIAGVAPEIFIGIARAHIFRKLFPETFASVRSGLLLSSPLFSSFSRRVKAAAIDMPKSATSSSDQAAIIFTTGSTGPPKGVQFTHGVFAAQLDLIRDYYKISHDDCDQPAFPLFALFSIALGATAVIPQMNAARPALVDPKKFIKTIIDHQVSYSFGSPAIWNVVSSYCLARGIRLPLTRVLMAGAPVSGELIERTRKIIAVGGEIHTPYGATESLPVASIEAGEIINHCWPLSRRGLGVCVGRPLPGIRIVLIAPVEGEIAHWRDVSQLPPGEIGEICVQGPVVTRYYDHNDHENRMAKIIDGDNFWHRIGDMGYLDKDGRLWFCGRKGHRVFSSQGVMYTIPCESIINEHPLVRRSALVGVGRADEQLPVMVVELIDKAGDCKRLKKELRALAASSELTAAICHFLVHPSFPVDIRHNAKIFREKLAVWAEPLIEQSRGDA